ncbi:MAG: NADH-quinone oxidoreductase subunit NuoD [Coriobacteriia bacterium]
MADETRPPYRLLDEGMLEAPVHPQGLRRSLRGVDPLATEHLIVNMGPQHPSTHGVLHVLLELDGETIVAAEASLGYLHRGIEKLAENRKYTHVATLLDRADYLSGIHSELAFAQAVEDLMEIEVPAKALWIRSLMSELTRLSSHLVWMGTFGMDIGAMAPFLYTLRDRDRILDLLEEITGARMMFNYIRPGGVVMDLPAGVDGRIRSVIDQFESTFDEYHDLLTGNEIFRARTRGVGVIPKERAVAFGLTGGSLRGSGLAWDVRKERPYAAYPYLDFDIPSGTVGDCWDRYMVRMEEMRVSIGLVRDILDGMPEGEHTAKVPNTLRPGAGEAYSSVESPRGEVGVHIISDGSDKPYRMRLRPPSFFNLSIIDEVLPGHFIADAVAIIGSLDIVLGEIDR